MNSVLVAFMLTMIAGLSTGIGSLIVFFTKKTNSKFLSFSLGFSAGVMIYVSMIEIFPEAKTMLTNLYSDKMATVITVLGFFGGMLLIALIDKFIPESSNPHEIHKTSSEDDAILKQKIMKTGLFTALAIAIHNFPEGIATFVSGLQDPILAIPIVIAIAIHNIPEGIAVSVPVYYATGSKKKAFIYSFASGLTEPLGAIIGYLILLPFLNGLMFGIIFAAVSGIMVYISFDELLPTAEEYGHHHLSVIGLIIGMIVMALSLILLM